MTVPARLVTVACVPASRLKSRSLFFAHLEPSGHGFCCTSQNTPPAEAVPGPTAAVSAIAMATARPSVLTGFISLSHSPAIASDLVMNSLVLPDAERLVKDS